MFLRRISKRSSETFQISSATTHLGVFALPLAALLLGLVVEAHQ